LVADGLANFGGRLNQLDILIRKYTVVDQRCLVVLEWSVVNLLLWVTKKKSLLKMQLINKGHIFQEKKFAWAHRDTELHLVWVELPQHTQHT
jgi:hypothetical protein